MKKQVASLSYAVRPAPLAHYFGLIALLAAALSLAPLFVSLIFKEFESTWRYSLVIAGLAGAGWLGRRIRPGAAIQVNEALVLGAGSFVFMPLIMTFPLSASGLSFWDAWFEAVSAVTTTGLSTAGSIGEAPRTFLFARAWMQWYGGLGVVILALALAVQPGLAAKRMAMSDAADDLVGGTKAHARRMVGVYGLLTLFGLLAVLLAGVSPWRGLLFTLSAVSTGGFSPSDASAGLLSWPAAGVLTVVSLAGALPLILYHNLFRRRGVQAEIGVQARGLLFFALATIALVWLSRLAAQPLSTLADYGRDAFTVFSAQTTAGFSVMDLEGLSAGAKGALIFSMTVGGGVASTAGGIKVLRLLILLHLIRVFIWKAGLPSRAAVPNRLFGRRLQEGEIQEALLIVFLYFAVIFISWLLFLLYDYPPLNALFDVVSAVGTVGLSTGVVGPDTPVVLKGVLIMDMLMGRLEVLALLVLLYPGTWFGRRGSS